MQARQRPLIAADPLNPSTALAVGRISPACRIGLLALLVVMGVCLLQLTTMTTDSSRRIVAPSSGQGDVTQQLESHVVEATSTQSEQQAPSTPEENAATINEINVVVAESHGSSSWGNPRIFEVFLFYNEIELLEIRIGELFDVVQTFILVETLETFQGARKVSHYDTMQFQLPEHFRKKVFHHKCDTLQGANAWAREQSARACMKLAVFAAGARLYDLVHLNDADEIANQPTMRRIQQRVTGVMNRRSGSASIKRRALASMFPMGITLHNHYYNFRTHNLKDWHADLFLILNVQQFLRKAKRLGGMKSRVPEGGWHCSWCFPTVAHFREKFLSFSHTETVDERNFAAENIWNCTCHGVNIFRYKGPSLIIVQNPLNMSIDAVPQYLKDHMHEKRFAFLLPNASTCQLPLS